MNYDEDPMAIARALQASFVSSGTHRGDGGGGSAGGGSRARGRGSSRGGLALQPTRAAIYASVPARSSPLNPMASRPSQPAPRPAPVAAAAGFGGSAAPTARAPARAPQQSTRASVPTVASVSAPQAPLIKPPAARGVSKAPSRVEEASLPDAEPPVVNGGTSGPDSSAAGLEAAQAVTGPDRETPPFISWDWQTKKPSQPAIDTAPAIRNGGGVLASENYQCPTARSTALSTSTTTNNGGGPLISSYQREASRATGNAASPVASTSVKSSAVNPPPTSTTANPVCSAASAAPKVIDYPNTPMTAESIIGAVAIRYPQRDNVPPRVPSEPAGEPIVMWDYQKAPAKSSGPKASSKPDGIYYNDPPATSSGPVASNSVRQPSNLVPPVREALAHDGQGNQTHQVDLMDVDDAPTITSFPVLRTNDVQNREEDMLDLLEPQQQCNCPKKPRGLGSSRWADPYGARVIGEGHFALATKEGNLKSAHIECKIHNPRPMGPLTPTAPEFVPRSGRTSTLPGLALTPQVPDQVSTSTRTTTGPWASGGKNGEDFPWLL
ncbi:hypothetical protein V8F06_003238 [Rhypophila decipiens]